MLKIREAVIVEGRYDKIKLSSIVDAPIIETNGFRVFSDKEKQSLIRKIADTRGILIMTDSDGGGFVIRNFHLNYAQTIVKHDSLCFAQTNSTPPSALRRPERTTGSQAHRCQANCASNGQAQEFFAGVLTHPADARHAKISDVKNSANPVAGIRRSSR